MKMIYGLYDEPDSAQRAFDGLRSAGISPRSITVMSAEPLEEYEFGSQDKKTVMTYIAAAGGVVGMITGILLVAITQKAWAINTGGMPIVTNWTNMVIIFELTMLGAVLSTVFTFLRTARLPSRLPELYDPEVSDGKILVGVQQPENARLHGIEQALRNAGTHRLKTIA